MDCPRSKIACCPLCLTRHKTITHLFKAVFYITPERNNETVNIATETANTELHTHLPDETRAINCQTRLVCCKLQPEQRRHLAREGCLGNLQLSFHLVCCKIAVLDFIPVFISKRIYNYAGFKDNRKVIT